jgi:hypothetical protein
VTGEELLIWGGTRDDCLPEYLADGAAYNPATRQWRLLPPAPLPSGDIEVSAWLGDRWFLWDLEASAAVYHPGEGPEGPWRPVTTPAPAFAEYELPAGVWTGREHDR